MGATATKIQGSRDKVERPSRAQSTPPPHQVQEPLAGNQEMLRVVGLRGTLKISDPSDPEEREAEKAAHAVIAGGHLPELRSAPPSGTVHRACASCEDEQTTVHRSAAATAPVSTVRRRGNLDRLAAAGHLRSIGRVSEHGDTSEHDANHAAHRVTSGSAIPAAIAGNSAASVSRAPAALFGSSGRPLDRTTRGYFEQRFGETFKDVRVHTDEQTAASARALNANAFTTGSDIGFNSGQFSTDTSSGRWLLAHELSHVVQQRGGRAGGVQRQVSSDPIRSSTTQHAAGLSDADLDRQRDPVPLSVVYVEEAEEPFTRYFELREKVSTADWQRLNSAVRARYVSQSMRRHEGGTAAARDRWRRKSSPELTVPLYSLLRPMPPAGPIVMDPQLFQRRAFDALTAEVIIWPAFSSSVQDELAARWSQANSNLLAAGVRVALVDPDGLSDEAPALTFQVQDHPVLTTTGALWVQPVDEATVRNLNDIRDALELELQEVTAAADLVHMARQALREGRDVIAQGHRALSGDYVTSWRTMLDQLLQRMRSYGGASQPFLATSTGELATFISSQAAPFAAEHAAFILANNPPPTNYDINQSSCREATGDVGILDRLALSQTCLYTSQGLNVGDTQTAMLRQAYREGHISLDGLENAEEQLRTRAMIGMGVTLALTIATFGLAGPVLGASATLGESVLFWGGTAALTNIASMGAENLYTSTHPLSDPYAQQFWMQGYHTPGQMVLGGALGFALGAAGPLAEWLSTPANAVMARQLSLATTAEIGTLTRLPGGVEARVIEPGVVELTAPGTPGAIRVTPEGFTIHAPAGAGGRPATVFQSAWQPQDLGSAVAPEVAQQMPWITRVRDFEQGQLAGGGRFSFGITDEGWFVVQPSSQSQTPVVLGSWGQTTGQLPIMLAEPGGTSAFSLTPFQQSGLLPGATGTASELPLLGAGDTPMLGAGETTPLLGTGEGAQALGPARPIPLLGPGAQFPLLGAGSVFPQLGPGPQILMLPAPSIISLPEFAWNPPAAFHTLPADRLPNLPPGYSWSRSGGRWVPARSAQTPERAMTAYVYGPDPQGRMNINLATNDGQFRSSSTAPRPPGLMAPPRNYPLETADFIEPATGLPWDRGHVQDHYDTLTGPGVLSSTTHRPNYIPEPKWWNRWVRNPLVQQIRGRGNSYRTIYVFGENPRTTADGTAIPDRVFFVETNPAGRPVDAWNVPFDHPLNGPTGLDALPEFHIDLSQLPSTPLLP